jgi:hypothetical protein
MATRRLGRLFETLSDDLLYRCLGFREPRIPEVGSFREDLLSDSRGIEGLEGLDEVRILSLASLA